MDEAHHVYGNQDLVQQLERHVSTASRYLLLSDLSQSRGTDIAYPNSAREVCLNEVVRSSKRIISAANDFGLRGGTASTEGGGGDGASCHHAVDGLPSNPTCSWPPGGARRVSRSQDHGGAAFGDDPTSLSLHDRLATVVPMRRFASGWRAACRRCSRPSMETGASLVNARRASATHVRDRTLARMARARYGGEYGRARATMVVCVGLDAEIRGGWRGCSRRARVFTVASHAPICSCWW